MHSIEKILSYGMYDFLMPFFRSGKARKESIQSQLPAL